MIESTQLRRIAAACLTLAVVLGSVVAAVHVHGVPLSFEQIAGGAVWDVDPAESGACPACALAEAAAVDEPGDLLAPPSAASGSSVEPSTPVTHPAPPLESAPRGPPVSL